MPRNSAEDLRAARVSVEGTLARWFALDKDMCIGVFTGPYAAWPAPVLADLPALMAADEFLADDPRNTEGLVFAALEAWQGLFPFSADPGYGGKSVYQLDATPSQPLIYENANPVVQRAAALLRFPALRFSSVKEIELSGLVDLVIGNG